MPATPDTRPRARRPRTALRAPRGTALLSGARRGVALALVLASILPYGRAIVCRMSSEGHVHAYAHSGGTSANVLTTGPETGTATADCHRAMACGISVLALRRTSDAQTDAPLIRDRDAARGITFDDRAIPPPLPPPPRA